MKTVSIQGRNASFHDIAARTFFGDSISTDQQDLFKDVFTAMSKSEYGVVAIENSLYGSINDVYDLLLQYPYTIIGEVYLRIEHCLIGLPGAKQSDITEVHSHPIAMAQCENFLDTRLINAQRFEHFDTAGSVENIKKWNKPYTAAIASRQAAQLHGMQVLAENIETNKENYTRFVVLCREAQKQHSPTKASIVLKTADKPGALHEALGVFARRELNLSKLESRPIIGKAWHYMFYVDIESPDISRRLDDCIEELQGLDCTVQLLGTYAKG